MANLVSHNRGKTFPPEPLTGQEMARLLETCSRKAPTGVRDRAMIVVMWRGQLRIGEALKLKSSDVDAEASTLRVLHGKGDKWRVVALDRAAMAVLQVWMEVRKGLGLNGHKPIFCTLRGGSISSAHVREMLPRRARKAGIEKRCNPHNLRHTGASELAAEGVPLLEVSAQLGHSSPATTSRYLHLLNPTARIERLRERIW